MKDFIQTIPKHLKDYVVDQEYDQYTAIDHASWRYIMKLSKDFFAENAHEKYLDGLKETGITVDRIPKITEMDEKLKKFGWRAVPITGFIPPAIFSEMLSLNIMPIACDMRKIENLHYTPSPDIVHEAAGHAPIVADPAYSSFLQKLGSVARKVIFAKEDCDVYEAILELSESKEDPEATEAQIAKAEKELEEAYEAVDYVSEATQYARIGWWSIEYGLIKKGDRFLIYGAGLLSSVGESFACLGDEVEKRPFTLDCIKQDYDITKPQPQLFYSHSFEEMEQVIEEFASSLAFRKGGTESLDKAIKARTVTTVQLDSGLQVSGELSKYRMNGDKVCYLHLTGPSQLSYNDRQLEGQGPNYHAHGFGTPIGHVKGFGKSMNLLGAAELASIGCVVGQEASFEFDSGVNVVGKCVGQVLEENQNLIFQFENCTVKLGDEVLFDPSWGTFDMACAGHEIPSVFGGAADRGNYLEELNERAPHIRDQKRNVNVKQEGLVPLYAKVRKLREEGGDLEKELEDIYWSLNKDFPKDWLLKMEILELLISKELMPSLQTTIFEDLENRKKELGPVSSLIDRGLKILKAA